MKKQALFLIVFGLFFTKSSLGQSPSVKDSIHTFYDSLFHHLESRFLYKDQVNWTQVKPYIKQKALQSPSFAASLKITPQLFDTIGGGHLNLFSKQGYFKSTLGKRLTQQDFHIEFLKKYEQRPPFEVKVLNKHYGYVMIPGMLLINISQDSLNRKTQAMYDAIMQVQQNHKIKGWVIDLRFNIGGNVYPMLAALYHLLGDTVVYKLLDFNQKPLKQGDHTLKKGAFYSGPKMETFAKVSEAPNTNLPVALIIGKFTNSAGEMTALAFRGRKNTVMIGENSYGSLTCNDMVELPYGVKITLTTSYAADQHSVYTKEIQPTIHVIKQANFQDLTKDQNVIEGIKFIDTQYKK
ncbi:MAG TPA: hypothetical protein DCS93_25805 [Microscillaceae bacterium]|nr:hypothetical protein [Microscillaceae bacterium]